MTPVVGHIPLQAEFNIHGFVAVPDHGRHFVSVVRQQHIALNGLLTIVRQLLIISVADIDCQSFGIRQPSTHIVHRVDEGFDNRFADLAEQPKPLDNYTAEKNHSCGNKDKQGSHPSPCYDSPIAGAKGQQRPGMRIF